MSKLGKTEDSVRKGAQAVHTAAVHTVAAENRQVEMGHKKLAGAAVVAALLCVVLILAIVLEVEGIRLLHRKLKA
jgi:hypothetical protein